MYATESFKVSGAPGTFPVIVDCGGYYQLSAHAATWGTLKLQQILPDGVTTFDLFGQPSNATPNTWVVSLAADGVLYYWLPPGTYNIVFAAGTVLSAALTRVPVD